MNHSESGGALLLEEVETSSVQSEPVRQAQGKPVRVKGASQSAETGTAIKVEGPNVSEHSLMEPIEKLKQDGASRVIVFALVIVLIGAVALGLLFVRESSLRRHALAALAQAEQARAQLEQSLARLQTEFAKQKEELSRWATDLQAATRKFEDAEAMNAKYQAEIVEMKKLHEAELSGFKKSLEEREGFIGLLQSNLKSLKARLEAQAPLVPAAMDVVSGPEVGTARGTRSTKRPLSGKVLRVNRTHRFIVVDLSLAQGARKGLFAEIYQAGQPLGEARIDRVYQNLSAATIVSEHTLQRVQEGDEVFLALP